MELGKPNFKSDNPFAKPAVPANLLVLPKNSPKFGIAEADQEVVFNKSYVAFIALTPFDVPITNAGSIGTPLRALIIS